MMDTANNQTDFALDMHGLNKLRVMSRTNKGKALDKTAQQFEALFIQMMLKQARDSSLGDPLFGSNQMDFYKDMFDQQLALTMATTGETGIGDVLVKQLKSTMGIVDGKAVGTAETSDTEDTKELQPLRRFIGSPKPIHIPGQQSVANLKGSEVSTPFTDKMQKQVNESFDTPESFVQALLPHAEKAAERLGISAKVLLAQAALETGWGKYISRDSEGQASNNLFNIKADQRWSGKSLEMNSLEYIGGKFIQEQSSFRAYDSYGDSFDDYVDFLKTNPRYSDAITETKGDVAFAQALQGAGYATDPDYAGKITRVMNNAALTQAFSGLKFSAK